MWETSNSAYGSGVVSAARLARSDSSIARELGGLERASLPGRTDSSVARELAFVEAVSDSAVVEDALRCGSDAAIARQLAEEEEDDDDDLLLGAPSPLAPRRHLDEACGSDAALARQLAEGDDLVVLSGGRPSEALARRRLDEADKLFPLELTSPFGPPPTDTQMVSAERKRLLDRLEDYSLTEHEVAGDGACQFRALAHQLYGAEAMHVDVRRAVVGELSRSRPRFEPFVQEEPYDAFLDRMRRPHEWGDHLTLKAAADAFRVHICLVTSYKQRGFISIQPTDADSEADDKKENVVVADGPPPWKNTPQTESPTKKKKTKKTENTIWLGFWAEVHYSSVRSTSS